MPLRCVKICILCFILPQFHFLTFILFLNFFVSYPWEDVSFRHHLFAILLHTSQFLLELVWILIQWIIWINRSFIFLIVFAFQLFIRCLNIFFHLLDHVLNILFLHPCFILLLVFLLYDFINFRNINVSFTNCVEELLSVIWFLLFYALLLWSYRRFDWFWLLKSLIKYSHFILICLFLIEVVLVI